MILWTALETATDTTAIYADVLDEDVQAGVDAMWAGA
jgi:hypothetical protein